MFSLVRASATRKSTSLADYNEAMIQASITRVYSDFSTGGTTVDTSTNYSAITGPRGVFTAMNFVIRGDITQTDY